MMRLLSVMFNIMFVKNFGTVRGIKIKSPSDRANRQIAKIYLPFYNGIDMEDEEYYNKNLPKVNSIINLIVKNCNAVRWEHDLPLDTE